MAVVLWCLYLHTCLHVHYELISSKCKCKLQKNYLQEFYKMEGLVNVMKDLQGVIERGLINFKRRVYKIYDLKDLLWLWY